MKRVGAFIFAIAFVITTTVLFLTTQASAKPYYEGKTITVIIGLGPASNASTIARLLAKHLSKSIKGNPKIVVKNMPGAAMMKAHHYILDSAPKDGTVIYYGPRKPIGVLLNLPGHDFKYRDFTILGGVQMSGVTVIARTDVLTGGLKTPAGIIKSKTLKYGGASPEHTRQLITMLSLDLLGADYKFIPGYRGSGKVRPAFMRGEVNIYSDAAHAYLKRIVPQLVNKGEALGIFTIPRVADDNSLIKNPMLPNVPSLVELYKQINKGKAPSGILWESIDAMIRTSETMQHVYLGPPGMDEQAAAAIREAIIPAFTSEAFRAEATKIMSYVPVVFDYKRAEEFIGLTEKISPEVVAYLKAKIARYVEK